MECKPQKIIAEKAGCPQSAVPKDINGKLTGRGRGDRERCTSSRDDHSFERSVQKSKFMNLGEFHKDLTKGWCQCVKSHHTTDVFRNNATAIAFLISIFLSQICLTWAKEKTALFLYSDEN